MKQNMLHLLYTKLIKITFVVSIAIIAIFATALPANAEENTPSKFKCDQHSCAYYMNWEDTSSYAYWGILPPPPTNLNGANAVWTSFSLSHRIFAIGYANNEKCVGFRLSAAPWEPQGMFGYECNNMPKEEVSGSGWLKKVGRAYLGQLKTLL